jgi:hypothetical protein
MTKMIFIPPFQMLDSTLSTYRHLMLPHLLDYEVYSAHFSRVKGLGQYIILDNGMAEGVETSSDKLIEIAYKYKVDELVLPDVLGEAEATYDKVLDFMADYRNRVPVQTLLGYVLQGNSPGEVMTHYNRVCSNAKLHMRINVWYLPRLLVTPRHPNARISVAHHILSVEGNMRKPIHFLGAAPSFISEAQSIRDVLKGRVRSMDTSAPYVYALEGKSIAPGVVAHRNLERYFTSLISPEVRQLAHQNCEVMNAWIGSQASASAL